MNYQEAHEYLSQVVSAGQMPGLDRIKVLLDLLGRPDRKQNFIHITGTNGKGSTGAFLASILQEAGYVVARFVSPALAHPLEQFLINGARMSEETYVSYAEEIIAAIGSMTEAGMEAPTLFEAETAIGMLFFADENCDFTLLEVGMGGALDSTNVIEHPVMAIITPVSMDHMQYLGNTLEEIALQKAGIIKGGHPVILGVQEQAAKSVIYTEYIYREREKAENNEKDGHASPSPFRSVNPDDIEVLYRDLNEQCFRYRNYELTTSLIGDYQVENAATAVLAAEALQDMGFTLMSEHIMEGIAKTNWFGRFTVIPGEPVLILDGAHNPDGARRLARSIDSYFPGRKVRFIMGVFKDKEYEKMLDEALPYCSGLHAVALPNWSRGLSPGVLKMEAEKRGVHAEVNVSFRDAAIEAARAAGPEGIVIAWGSLSYLVPMLEAWEKNVLKRNE